MVAWSLTGVRLRHPLIPSGVHLVLSQLGCRGYFAGGVHPALQSPPLQCPPGPPLTVRRCPVRVTRQGLDLSVSTYPYYTTQMEYITEWNIYIATYILHLRADPVDIKNLCQVIALVQFTSRSKDLPSSRRQVAVEPPHHCCL